MAQSGHAPEISLQRNVRDLFYLFNSLCFRRLSCLLVLTILVEAARVIPEVELGHAPEIS